MIWFWRNWNISKSYQSGLIFTFTSLFPVTKSVCDCPCINLVIIGTKLSSYFICNYTWLSWWNLLIQWNIFLWNLYSCYFILNKIAPSKTSRVGWLPLIIINQLSTRHLCLHDFIITNTKINQSHTQRYKNHN